jgi:isopentenyl-diphosphate delta-isomerase
MKVIIVNEQDEVIGTRDWTTTPPDDITRVSALWVYNSKKEVLIAQRALTKRFSPGLWGPAAAGTVEEGETYLSNILKETQEELGIELKESDLVVASHELQKSEHTYYRQFFMAKLDLPIEAFTIQKSEVESLRWIASEELYEWLEKSPEQFSPSFRTYCQEFKILMK